MKLNRNCQVWKACSSQARRYEMRHARLQGDKLIATCGSMLAVVDIEREPDDSDGFVPVDAIKLASKAKTYGQTVELSVNGSVKVQTAQGETTFVRPTEGEFPTWERVIPAGPAVALTSISLDPALLLDLAHAIGMSKNASAVRLEFYSPTGPIKVSRGKSADAVGYLMPCTIED